MMGCVLYFAIGFVLASVLVGLNKGLRDFINFLIVIVGWPFCVMTALLVLMVCCVACVVDAFKGGVK